MVLVPIVITSAVVTSLLNVAINIIFTLELVLVNRDYPYLAFFTRRVVLIPVTCA